FVIRPLGVSFFALLISIGGASLIGRSFIRIRPLAPIIAVPILSLVNSMILFALLAAIRPPVTPADPVALLMPGAAYDAVLGLVFGPLAVSIRDRRNVEERVDWGAPPSRSSSTIDPGTTDRRSASSCSASPSSWPRPC